MNRTKLISSILATLALLLLILWMAGAFVDEVDSELRPAPVVAVDEASLHMVSATQRALTATVPGTTVARDETVISSRLLARIDKVHVRAGDVVTAGQALINLEKADLEARVKQAGDQVKATAAQLENARLRLTRTRELAAKQMAATAEVDAAVAAHDALKAQFDQGRQMLNEAQIVLGYGTIKAPFGGRIVERLAEPGDTVAPAQPLLLLYDPLSIRVEAPVQEALVLSLDVGQAITAVVDASGQLLEGRIDEIVPAADAASRSFVIKATLAYNPGLMPGMFVRLLLPAGLRQEISIPAALVTEVGELDLVYVYKDEQVTRRYVRLGERHGDQVVVTSGLAAGEIVVEPAALR
jgi:RND family efflux transporter MFP subunit